MIKEMLQRTVIAKGGRNGTIYSKEENKTYTLRKPVEMGGKKAEGTDPEALFAAGYAACLASSIEYLLSANNVDYQNVTVEATNHLMMVPDQGFQFNLTVKSHIEGVSKAVEQTYIEKGQAFCPFSKSIQGNVTINHMD